MRWGAAIRDIVVIITSVVITGVVISYSAGYAGVRFADAMVRLGLMTALIMTIGFAISGVHARTHRWRHAFVVAVGVWLTGFFLDVLVAVGLWLKGFVNVRMVPAMLLSWLVSCVPIFICMGLGVSLSFLFVRSTGQGPGAIAETRQSDLTTPPELQ